VPLLMYAVFGSCNFLAVLTWAVYCLAVHPDIQAAAREEVKRVCSETGDVTADDVDNMTYVTFLITIYTLCPRRKDTQLWVITLANVHCF